MKKESKAGGYRPGAGRPKGTGKYKEATSPIRVPNSLVTEIKNFIALKSKLPEIRPEIPFYSARIAAGMPSSLEDHIEEYVNLTDYLVSSPSDVFLLRAKGDSMINAGIYEDDLLVVNRAIEPRESKIVIAALDGEFTVKRLRVRSGQQWLFPENDKYPPILLDGTKECRLLGVVVHVIHSV